MSGRLLLTAALAAMASLAASVPASAGTYVVTACGASSQHANHSWTLTNTLTAVQGANQCGGSDGWGGLFVRERTGGSFSPLSDGQRAGWTFTPPAGLMVSALTYSRWLFKSGDNNLQATLQNAAGATLESCSIVFPADSCSVGEGGGRSATLTGLNTTALSIGVGCRLRAPATSCPAGGGSSPEFGAVLYDAAVTVSDVGPPSAGGVSGELLDGGWQHGARRLAVGGSDASGISQAMVLVDGNEVAHTALACDYTYAKPCPDSAGTAVTVDTSTLTDGRHDVQGGVVDAAGNRSVSSAQAVTVDNTAPAGPEGLTAPSGWRREHTVQLTGRVPGGQISPVTTVRWQVCDEQASSCDGLQTAPVAGDQVAVTPSVPDGRHVVRVWLVDAAGNEAPGQAQAVPVHVDTHAPAAPAQLAARVASSRAVTLTWTAPGGQDAPLTTRWQLCPSNGQCLAVQRADSTPSVQTGVLPRGVWTARVWLADAAGNEDAAHPATVTFTVPAQQARTSPRLRLSVRRSHRRVRVSAKLASKATGSVTLTIVPRDRRGHTMRSIHRRLKLTHAQAQTTFTLPRNARRAAVTASYAGNAQLRAQRTTRSVRVTP